MPRENLGGAETITKQLEFDMGSKADEKDKRFDNKRNHENSNRDALCWRLLYKNIELEREMEIFGEVYTYSEHNKTYSA